MEVVASGVLKREKPKVERAESSQGARAKAKGEQ